MLHIMYNHDPDHVSKTSRLETATPAGFPQGIHTHTYTYSHFSLFALLLLADRRDTLLLFVSSDSCLLDGVELQMCLGQLEAQGP